MFDDGFSMCVCVLNILHVLEILCICSKRLDAGTRNGGSKWEKYKGQCKREKTKGLKPGQNKPQHQQAASVLRSAADALDNDRSRTPRASDAAAQARIVTGVAVSSNAVPSSVNLFTLLNSGGCFSQNRKLAF